MLEEFLASANPEQKFCVELGLGQCYLVLAGAGSGKTAMLTARVAYLNKVHNLNPDNILALTFTRAAAEEMRHRACKMAGYPSSQNPFAINTFHSFCLSVIKEKVKGNCNWERLGYNVMPQIADETSHFKEGGEESGSLKTSQNVKDTNNTLKLDDLIPCCLTLLTKFPELQEYYQQKFAEILVDEYQDCSPEQLQLLRSLKNQKSGLLLVGDNFQAIYGFRGAQQELVENTPKFFPNINMVKLETNYRSTANILHFANRLFSDSKSKFSKKLFCGRKSAETLFVENQKVALRIFSTSFEEAVFVAKEIKRLNEKYQMDWNAFSILFRINQLRPYYREAVQKILGEAPASKINFETIHGAKGLQYPVVFLVGLEENLFPYNNNARPSKKSGQLAEEKRLFYVGITRAEMLLYISACKVRKLRGKYKRNKPSSFLLESCGWRAKLKTVMLWNLKRASQNP